VSVRARPHPPAVTALSRNRMIACRHHHARLHLRPFRSQDLDHLDLWWVGPGVLRHSIGAPWQCLRSSGPICLLRPLRYRRCVDGPALNAYQLIVPFSCKTKDSADFKNSSTALSLPIACLQQCKQSNPFDFICLGVPLYRLSFRRGSGARYKDSRLPTKPWWGLEGLGVVHGIHDGGNGRSPGARPTQEPTL
jgi:hypothetical protein